MAVAKRPTKPVAAAKMSKRKAAAAKKTIKVKTKITAKDAEVVDVVDAVESEVGQLENLMTARRQRVIEKAKVRPIEAVESTVVDAVKITDVSGVVYDKADYDAMVEMYDSTIKDIKEGEIVRGTILGVTHGRCHRRCRFQIRRDYPDYEFRPPINIKVGDDIEVYLEQIEDPTVR